MSTPLERSVQVRCSVERAFTLFTSNLDIWWPKSHRRFEQSALYLEAKTGGRFLERSSSGEEVLLGEVLLCDPPEHLIYTWYPGAMTKPTEVEVRFRSKGGNTVVEITHSEAESALGDAWFDRVKVFTRAWDEVLPAFIAFVDTIQKEGMESQDS